MLLLAVLLSPAWLSSTHANNIVQSDCADFINESPAGVSCGFVSVPVNHDLPDGKTIQLPVVIAKSTQLPSASSKKAVLIPGGGGPGSSMGFGYQYSRGEYLAPYESLRSAGYDVVLIDQRGSGYSTPRLNCPETILVFKALVTRRRTIDQEIEQYHHAIATCRKRLARAFGNISAYDTRQSARDFLAIMNTLPHRRWSTIATSYATVIAQAMIIERPDAFEYVVLDSPVPLDYQQPLSKEATYQAIVKTISRCRQTDQCNSRYPTLATQFNDILVRARQRPYGIKIKVYSTQGDASHKTLIVDDNALLAIFFNALYNNESIAMLPKVIAKIHKGKKQALKPFAENYWYQSTDPEYADGLNMTVHCKERQILEENYMAEHPEFAATLSADSRKELAAQPKLCKAWQVSSDNKLLPVKKFSAKTLILAGSLDPVISQADIYHTTDNFSNVSTSVIPGAGHSVWFQSACARQQVINFLKDKAAATKRCSYSLPTFK